MLQLKVRRLHPDAKLPKYHTPDASGFDLEAIESVVIHRGETKVVKTGLAVELWRTGDILYEIQIRPRGGTSLNTPLRIANSPGTVDSDYRGEIGIIVTNTGDQLIVIRAGDRIAQAVVCPVIQCQIVEVDNLSETQRGSGAYGHTGAR